MSNSDVLAWGRLTAADFSEKTLEIRVDGDMPKVSAGRYAIIPADGLRTLVMQADLWRESQK